MCNKTSNSFFHGQFISLLILLIAGGFAEPFVHASQETANAPMTLDLSGRRWQMEGIRPGQGVIEGFFEHFGEVCPSTFNWNGATVPGDVYTDLWRAGEIDDPHFGRNGMRAKWVMEKEWWYRCQFAVAKTFEGKVVRLVFEGVDYACDVWLNGKHLGSHEGMFSTFEFDVGSILHYGSDGRANGLVVRLDPPPRSYRHVAGQKFAWHGDYWRTLTPIGIWKPVRLEATNPIQLSDIYPKSQIHADGSATVNVQVTLVDHKPSATDRVRVQAVVRGKDFFGGPYKAEAHVSITGGQVTTTIPVHVPKARLWWPWDLGQPDRYVVETSVYDATGELSDRQNTVFGIREIRMDYNPGYTREEVRNPWTMFINGKRTFLRSATWGGPPDIFYGRNNPETYRTLVQQAKDANINNLRIFGWHPTEVDGFYDLCDELGITVWQDLIPLASVRLPEDKAFRDATYAEAISVMKQLRHHPSLVLLEGGEEMFFGSQGLEYNADFLIGLGEAIRPYTDLPYVATSPLNWPSMLHERGLGGRKDSGHTHYLFYAMGARLLEDYIAEWDFAVIPEFAISSAPCADSIRKFIPDNEVWPPGPSWGYHWADLDTFVALNQQVLGNDCTESLKAFTEGTQIAQGTIFQWGIEHMRRRKPKSSAISICHFITFAPDMKWGIVDYYQQPKLSYDFVKRAYQPLLVSLQFDKRRWLPRETLQANIWLVNDLHEEFKDCKLSVMISNSGGRRLYDRTLPIGFVSPDSSVRSGTVEWKVKGRLGESFQVTAILRNEKGRTISANHYDLLMGDQDQARQDSLERAKAFQAIKEPYPTADYYRFFPELFGQDPNASPIHWKSQ